MNIKDIPLYFDEDEGDFYLKTGYTCILSGFVDQYITIILPKDSGKYILMTPDDDISYSGDWSDIDVYELVKVS